uniref:KIAA1328 n=1 Tax=Leptobrachium leishanense TaxID=445787 RepID=A0A8C5LMX1_9ANUR
MADVAGEGAAGYWSLDASDEEQQVVYVSGLPRGGNLRPMPKHRSKKTEETKLKGCAPADDMTLPSSWRPEGGRQVDPEGGGMKSASLKDLCPEDKRRIANLIQELARVSEAKEVTEERLKTEHESFEKKIRQLEEQNDLIVTEREALHQQYRECQELLSLYQKYLSEQQDKLNQSLGKDGTGGGTAQQVAKNPRKPTSSELNGSYLNHSCHKPSSGSESSCSLAATRGCRTESGLRNTFHYNTDQCCSGNRLPKKPATQCASMGPVHQNHACSSTMDQSVAPHCPHCKMPNVPGTCPPNCAVRGPHEARSMIRRSPTPLKEGGLGTRPRESTSEKNLTEERRHELLLQKMELEMEKEHLHRLLVHQEEKLIAKQRELQQSRLDYCNRNLSSGCQPPETADVSGPPSKTPTLTNGFRHSPVCTPPPPSSTTSSKKQRRSRETLSEKKVLTFNGGEHDGLTIPPTNSLATVCRKDAAMSPSAASEELELGAAGTSHRNIYRYETSLIEMLEAVSPISMQRRPSPPSDPCDYSFLSPAPRSQLKPSRRPPLPITRAQHRPADPEESRMLEDIFFIC